VSTIAWNDAKRSKMDPVYEREFWTESFVQWSPQGTLVATMHRPVRPRKRWNRVGCSSIGCLVSKLTGRAWVLDASHVLAVLGGGVRLGKCATAAASSAQWPRRSLDLVPKHTQRASKYLPTRRRVWPSGAGPTGRASTASLTRKCG
jgi:hypothetical protein